MDAYCPSRHLTAVLVANGDGPPPVVMVHGSGEPVPQLLLLPSGDLAAAIVTTDGGAQYIAPVGTPRQSFDVDRPSCGSTGGVYRLNASALVRALSSGKKKIGLGRAETE